MEDAVKVLEQRLKIAEQELARQHAIADSKDRYSKRGFQVTIRELSKTNAALEIAEKKLKEQNRQLEELNRVKNQFMGIASHDLRNPLSIIHGYVDLLRGNMKDQDLVEEVELLSHMEEAISYMMDLINNFLDHNKIESGKFPIVKEPGDINKLLEEVVAMNSMKAQSKKIDLVLITDPLLKKFYFDSERITQVFQNLVNNSLKFSEQGTETCVETRLARDHVLIQVKDQGLGVPDDEIPNLFNPFQQSSTRATKGEKGSGLGLAIVKKIVDAHEGSITVKSKIRRGTAFQVKLPYTT